MRHKLFAALAVFLLAILMTVPAIGAEVNSAADGSGAMTKWLVIVLVPCLIAGVVCFVFWGQMKSARIQSAASEYITEDGVEIHNREDVFSHSTETRRKIQTSSDKKN